MVCVLKETRHYVLSLVNKLITDAFSCQLHTYMYLVYIHTSETQNKIFYSVLVNTQKTLNVVSSSLAFCLCSSCSLAQSSSSLFILPCIFSSKAVSSRMVFSNTSDKVLGSNASGPPLDPPPTTVLARRSTYSQASKSP